MEEDPTDLIGDEEYANDSQDEGIVEEPEVEEPASDELSNDETTTQDPENAE